jgi:hypothetical protein
MNFCGIARFWEIYEVMRSEIVCGLVVGFVLFACPILPARVYCAACT